MRTSRRSFLTPGFILVWSLTFITFLAAFQMFPTVPLRLRELGASLAESGRFMTVFTAGSAIGALFTGPLGDRVGQRRMAVVTALLFALCVTAYGMFRSRWGFYILAFPHGVVWSGLLTATMSSLGGVLPAERRADGLSIYGLASPGGVIFGPLVGLWVYRHFSFAPISWTLGAAFLVLGLLALNLPSTQPQETPRSAFQLPDLQLVAPCSVLLATALGYGALGTYTAQEALACHFPPLFGKIPTDAAFLSTMAIGMVLMRIVMSRIGFGPKPLRMLPGMLWAAFAGLVLLAVLPGGVVRHGLSALLYGAGYSMVHTLVNTWVLDAVEPGRRGAAFGATLFSFDLGIGLGSLLIGQAIGLADYRWGWALAALFTLSGVPLSYRLLRPASK